MIYYLESFGFLAFVLTVISYPFFFSSIDWDIEKYCARLTRLGKVLFSIYCLPAVPIAVASGVLLIFLEFIKKLLVKASK